MSAGKSEHFLRIDQAAARSPLVVKLPAPRQQLSAFGKTIRAAEHDDDQVSRRNFCVLALLLDLSLAMCGKNQAVPRPGCLAGLHAVHAVRAEELIRIPQHVGFLLAAAIERNLPLLLG